MMIKHLLRKYVYTLLTIISCLVLLTCTQQGTNLLFRVSSKLLPGEIQYQSLKGSVISGVTISGVVYATKQTEISVANVTIVLSLKSLLLDVVTIDRLEINNMSVVNSISNTTDPNTQKETNFNWPSLEITYFEFNDIDVISGHENINLHQAEGSIAVSNHGFTIQSSHFQGQYQKTPFSGGLSFDTQLSEGISIHNSWVYWGEEKYTLSKAIDSPSTYTLTAMPWSKNYHFKSSQTNSGSWSIRSQIPLLSEYHPYTQLALNLNYQPNSKTLKLTLQGTDNVGHNEFKGYVQVAPQSSGKAFSDWFIEGTINFSSNDLKPWLKPFPDVVFKKSQVKGKVQLSGTLAAPFMNSVLEGDNIEFSIPRFQSSYLVENIKAQSNALGNFYFYAEGKVTSGSGQFEASGSANPFKKGFPHEIELRGTDMAVMDTRHAKVIASPDIKIFFEDLNTLNVRGNINIPRATIHLKPENFGPCCSDDVVYIGGPKQTTNRFKIKPNIALNIHPDTFFMGYGFESHLSGQLSIHQNTNGRNEASGSIYLHKGKYKFPGKTFTITQGQLYYPPGTSLSDPQLKAELILRSKQSALSTEDTTTEGLSIQGRLLAPKITFIGQSNGRSIGLADNELGQSLQTMAHAALYYNSRSGSLLENIDKKLNLNEIGIQTEEGSGSLNDDSDNPMFFVVGKKLSSRVYMQYKKGIDKKHDQVRMEYEIGNHWGIGVEAGTGENGTTSGVDLSFKLEKD